MTSSPSPGAEPFLVGFVPGGPAEPAIFGRHLLSFTYLLHTLLVRRPAARSSDRACFAAYGLLVLIG